ncbi:MAG: sugar ABC transporter ATP-binding protein [Candidatus Eremiobacteraeota bacterium]|nr:sugar ABC transporter ATP-binding protein [Candidatus Eremiobacteraeota bacterium]
MQGIVKTFPGVRALDGVDLEVEAGEVHALVGENGAGKSTLMKILAGATPADSGTIEIEGRAVAVNGPRDAERLGIGMIYQEFNLVPDLNAVQNIVLGHEPTRGALLDVGAAIKVATAALAELGVVVPLGVPTRRLSVAQQQTIEISKAIARSARILVLDEPTAALTEREIDALFGLIRKLRANGVAFVYISHRLEELPRIADRVTVMRDGRTVETGTLAEMPQEKVIRLMVGRTLDTHFPELPDVPEAAPVVLEVKNLSRGIVNDVTFSVRAGEIVGLAGLVGAGRTEILRAIAGADIPARGEVLVEGKPPHILSPAYGIAAGIALITEDRKAQGLVLGMNVRENITLAHLDEYVARSFLIERSKEVAVTNKLITELSIRTPSTEQIVRNLSGGNQQKVVLAKWLIGVARIFLFDEPTRGIDVGSKAEIYGLMVELARRGAGIVMVSSELPEVLGMAHRIFVVRAGALQAELSHRDATPDKVIAIATGAAA